MLCFFRFYDSLIKEILSDIAVEGIVNITKSGYGNPISTFFSNLLIVEGPKVLKEQLFAAFEKYIDDEQEINQSFSDLIDLLIRNSFDESEYESETSDFIRDKSTTLLHFFYDTIIKYME